MLRDLEVGLVSVTGSSPYCARHFQRPARRLDANDYEPPEDPLVGVARHIRVTAELKAAVPEIVYVGSAYSYLQQWLPNVGAGGRAIGYDGSRGTGANAPRVSNNADGHHRRPPATHRPDRAGVLNWSPRCARHVSAHPTKSIRSFVGSTLRAKKALTAGRQHKNPGAASLNSVLGSRSGRSRMGYSRLSQLVSRCSRWMVTSSPSVLPMALRMAEAIGACGCRRRGP